MKPKVSYYVFIGILDSEAFFDRHALKSVVETGLDNSLCFRRPIFILILIKS